MIETEPLVYLSIQLCLNQIRLLVFVIGLQITLFILSMLVVHLILHFHLMLQFIINRLHTPNVLSKTSKTLNFNFQLTFQI